MAGKTNGCAITRVRVALYGAVQGVGFRPYVLRLANELGLSGWVINSTAGLLTEAEGREERVRAFVERIEEDPPPASVIVETDVSWIVPAGSTDFEIRESEDHGATPAVVTPDLATCPDCVAEVRDLTARRHGYPFTNCTRCGPRYTIVSAIPYDRANTTLSSFFLCSSCASEYRTITDRRLHAQAIACPRCGPRLETSVGTIAVALAAGEIVALKGIGGFQLLADAGNSTAVARLRRRKGRDAKPFAVMMPDLGAVRRACRVSEAEERALCSRAAPIVLLERAAGCGVVDEVSGSSCLLGVMLPYSPLHHLVMQAFPHPIVATSGNLSGEPIAFDDEGARRLCSVADVVASHDRPIARPCDDSVVRVCLGEVQILRRARGFVPLPMRISGKLPPVLATGAHLKNTVAIAIGRDVFLSAHVGDLDTPEARRGFENAIDDLCRLYRFTPEIVACDLHRDYASSIWARASGKPVIEVQHHHAHAAACAAENGVAGPCLAMAWDGTGYGTDGTIWGGEVFLRTDTVWERVGHLRPFRLPGGEAAIREGWRAAESVLQQTGIAPRDRVIRRMLEQGINAPWTTSMGRLFDAVASITGIARESRFEGEAAMMLEQAASRAGHQPPYPLDEDGDWRPMIDCIKREREAMIAARRLHHTLARWAVLVARRAGARDIVLSGGVFQNRLLTELTAAELESGGFRVHLHRRVPPNDGGIAFGQAVLSADYL